MKQFNVCHIVLDSSVAKVRTFRIQSFYVLKSIHSFDHRFNPFHDTNLRSMKFLSPEVALYLYKSTHERMSNTAGKSGLVPLVATWNC